jgi:DNA-directed RNA polymerase
VVADRVAAALRKDLETGQTDRERALAALWLDHGITRSLVKGPVLATPYGGSYMSVSDTLLDILDAHLGYVPLEEFAYRVAMPSKYLASHLWRELKEVVEPCLVVKKWLGLVTRKVLVHGKPLEWTSPTGFPMRVADRMLSVTQIPTLLYGQRKAINFADAPLDAKFDPAAGRKVVSANFVHSMDAALLCNVTGEMSKLNVPVLVNHDCFATTAAHATELHNRLLWGFAGLYRTDWLAVMREEVQARTGISLPKLPEYGQLPEGQIGTNPYIFS